VTTYIAGQQLTSNILSTERKVDIPPELYWLQPDTAPLVILTAGGKGADGLPIKKRAAINPEYKMLEKQPHGCWTAVNYSTGYTAGATTIILDDVTFIKVGNVLEVVTTNEKLHVTGKSNGDNTVTVTRSVGPTAAATIVDNAPIYVIGTAKGEGAAIGGALMVQNRDRTNYCQIFEQVVDLSDTLINSDLYQGKKEPELFREAYMEIRKQVERAFLMGEPGTATDSDGKTVWFTGGAYYWIVNGGGHVTTATTTFTKAMWLTFTRNAFGEGSDTKVGLAAPLVIEMLDYWKDSKLEMKPMDYTYGIKVAQWETGQGTLLIARDRELRYSPAGTTTVGYGGTMIVLDRDNLEYRYQQNRDVVLKKDVVQDGRDGRVHKYLGQVGLGLTLPETMAVLDDVSTYA